MTPLQPARTVARSADPSVRDAARLELLECFLEYHDDLARCVKASLETMELPALEKKLRITVPYSRSLSHDPEATDS